MQPQPSSEDASGARACGCDPAERQHPRAQTGPSHKCSSQEPGALLQGEHGPQRRGREAADSRSLPAETWVACSPNVLTLVHSAACCAHTVPCHLDRELCWVGPAHSGGVRIAARLQPLGSPAWDVEPHDPRGLGPRAEGALTEASQSRRKSTLRYALMPSTAPGRVTPRRSSAKRTTYGMVAVIHTTWGEHSVTRPHRHRLAWLGTESPSWSVLREGTSDWEARRPKQSQDTSSKNASWSETVQCLLSCVLSFPGIKMDKQFGKEGALLLCTWAMAVGSIG